MTRRELRRIREAEERAREAATGSVGQSVLSAAVSSPEGAARDAFAPGEVPAAAPQASAARPAAEAPTTRHAHHAQHDRSGPIHIPVMTFGGPTRPLPPLVPTTTISAGSRRRRRLGRQGLGLFGMLFAGAMAIATCLPANAVLSSSEPGTGAVSQAPVGPQRTTRAAAATPEHSQTLHGDGTHAVSVNRDGVTVESREQVAEVSHLRLGDTFTNDPNGTIQWPFMVGVPISDYFGPRIAPTEGASTFHEGVDFDPGAGAPIQAIADGVVREVDPYNDNGLGVHVIIDHMIDGNLVSSVYGHMRPGSLRVTSGQKVKVGNIIGLVGDTGISTGAHLHFEIRLNGTQAVDPYAWLQEHAN